MLLEERDDLGLLSGRAATADHRRTLTRQLHELVLVIPQAHLQRDGEAELSLVSIVIYPSAAISWTRRPLAKLVEHVDVYFPTKGKVQKPLGFRGKWEIKKNV